MSKGLFLLIIVLGAHVQASDTLTLMTMNLWRSKREALPNAISEYFKSCDKSATPDILLLQEVVFTDIKNGKSTSSADHFSKAFGYEARFQRRQSDDEGSAILSRYPFSHFEAIEIEGVSPYQETDKIRIAIMAEFNIPSFGLARVIDVHLAYQEEDHLSREKQLKAIFDWDDRRQKLVKAHRVFFGGDLNSIPDWSEMSVLRDRRPDIEDHNNKSIMTWGLIPGFPTQRLDYIFSWGIGKAIKFLEEKVLFRWGVFKFTFPWDWTLASDHSAVLHKYSVN